MDGGRTRDDAGEDSGGVAGMDGGRSRTDAGLDSAIVADAKTETLCEEDAGASTSQKYTVPSIGGRFVFCTPHGTEFRFDFSSSEAGLVVTATWVDPKFQRAVSSTLTYHY